MSSFSISNPFGKGDDRRGKQVRMLLSERKNKKEGFLDSFEDSASKLHSSSGSAFNASTNIEDFKKKAEKLNLLDDDRFNKLLTDFEQRVEGIRMQNLLTQTRRRQ